MLGMQSDAEFRTSKLQILAEITEAAADLLLSGTGI